MLLVEGSERDSTGCDGTGIPACLQEYFQHVKDSVREPDLNDVFMVVSPVEKGKGVYRVTWNDTMQFTTPSIEYHSKQRDIISGLIMLILTVARLFTQTIGEREKSR